MKKRISQSHWSKHLFGNPSIPPLILGVVLSFCLGSAAISGWPAFLRPNLDYPYVYAGDALSHLWLTQRAIEGWIFNNPRNGFPFGSSFLDYPGSDIGNLLVLKLLGKISGSYYAASNLYFLIGFPATFASTYIVCKKIELRAHSAFACALLFAFLPFHFFRLLMGHLFYTWYFVVPVYFYLGYVCLNSKNDEISKSQKIKLTTAAIFASCFGVYFAFFGLILIAILGGANILINRAVGVLKNTLILSIAICSGVFLNVIPNAINTLKNGVNIEVAQRLPIETEIYALKLTHLLLPHLHHRIDFLRDFSNHYTTTFPLSNTVSSVGFIGIFGFLILIANLLRVAAGQPLENLQRTLLTATTLMLFISTVGGLSVIFSMLISPTIRGWDRMGIFIGFFLLLTAFSKLDRFLFQRKFKEFHKKIILVALTAFGIWDQTAVFGSQTGASSKTKFEADREFVAKIEEQMPKRAAILQIPYISFPESAPLHGMHSYDQLVGFLNSKELRWSGGGMAGRRGDLFYRALLSRPLEEQVAAAKNLGFSGIYVDKSGYADHGTESINELKRILNREPAIIRDDGGAVFFSLI